MRYVGVALVFVFEAPSRLDVGVYDWVVAKGYFKRSKLNHRTPAFDRDDFRAAKNTATMNPEHKLHSCSVNCCNPFAQACAVSSLETRVNW